MKVQFITGKKGILLEERLSSRRTPAPPETQIQEVWAGAQEYAPGRVSRCRCCGHPWAGKPHFENHCSRKTVLTPSLEPKGRSSLCLKHPDHHMVWSLSVLPPSSDQRVCKTNPVVNNADGLSWGIFVLLSDQFSVPAKTPSTWDSCEDRR